MSQSFFKLATSCLFFGILSFNARALASSFGYTQNVPAERDSNFEEVVIYLPELTTLKTPNFKILNAELSKEFRTKYIQQFGTVDTDALTYRDPKYAEMSDDNRRGIIAEQASVVARKNFAEFMVKRMTESHVDRFIKEDPQMRPIYEVKEKISNVKVEINKDTKLDIKYSLAGNTLDLNFINPYLESRLISYMDPSAFGPASAMENRLFLGKQITPRSRINIYAAQMDGISTEEFVHVFRSGITGSLASSSWFKSEGPSPRETRTSVSMSSSF